MQAIKIIAIDIDGTLLDDHYQCDRETQEMLQKLQQEGIHILLCTGRPLRTTKKMAEELGISSYLITDNGAVVYHMPTETTLVNRSFSPSVYQEVISVLEQTKLHLDVTSLTGMYALPHDKEVSSMYVKYRAQPVVLTSMAPVTEPIVKATLFAGPEEIEKVMLDLPEKLHHLPIQCFRSGPTFIDVIHAESSKGNALHFLSHHLGIASEMIMAIGNYYNDLDMIRLAGVGVAMGNAPDDVKQASTFVTDSNNEQGVRKAIQRMLPNLLVNS